GAVGQATGARARRPRDHQAWCHPLAPAVAVGRRGPRSPRIGAAAMMRILNICVIGALVLAAADVYKIKFESTRQAQRVAKLRLEIRRGRAGAPDLHPAWS